MTPYTFFFSVRNVNKNRLPLIQNNKIDRAKEKSLYSSERSALFDQLNMRPYRILATPNLTELYTVRWRSGWVIEFFASPSRKRSARDERDEEFSGVVLILDSRWRLAVGFPLEMLI